MKALIYVVILCMSLVQSPWPSDAPHDSDVSASMPAQPLEDEIVEASISVLKNAQERLVAFQEIDSKTIYDPVQEMTNLLEYMISMDVSSPDHAAVLTFDRLVPSPGYYNIYYPEDLSPEASALLTDLAFRNACGMALYRMSPSSEHYYDIRTVNSCYTSQIDIENKLSLTSQYTVAFLFYPVDDGQYDVGVVSFEAREGCTISTAHYLGKGNDTTNQYAMDSSSLLDLLVFSVGGISKDSNPRVYDVNA